MLASTVEKYREFWAGKTTPLSRGDAPEFLRLMAEELKLLFNARNAINVLEIGCGNGQLFDYLGFSPRSYRGVDFGPRMLEVFRRKHPDLDLIETEASSYADDRTYDLILAHDVVSHFSPKMLSEHCRNARRMMHSESLLIWACIPWRPLRHTYDLGMWTSGGNPKISEWVKRKIRRIAGRDVMGRWYTPGEISKIAEQNSLCAHFHGSITHPYRFHAVLQPTCK